MQVLKYVLLLLVLSGTVAAAPLTGEWRVEYGGVTERNGSFSAGQTIIVHHDGKVYISDWSSGVAGPTMDLIGTADPGALKELRRQLSTLDGVHHQVKGGEWVRGFTLYRKGKEHQHFSWQKGSERLPNSLQKAVKAFEVVVASAKK